MINQFQGEENGELPISTETAAVTNILQFYGIEGKIMGSIGACLGLLSGIIGFLCSHGNDGLEVCLLTIERGKPRLWWKL